MQIFKISHLGVDPKPFEVDERLLLASMGFESDPLRDRYDKS